MLQLISFLYQLVMQTAVMSENQLKAVLFDLDQTLLDRTASLKSFVDWQAKGMLRSQVSDRDLFIKRFIELDANGKVWKDRVYKILIDEFKISGWSIEELTTSDVGMYSIYIPDRRNKICDAADIACNDFRKLPDIVSLM